ncbi:ABC transporter ATP-binding protein [Gryllotalpicola protaetiae]|uniref:ABC transporter ATP-binding protein n=1 Tax=Gryllotalpicola protaetiae TaxID=2419771 RepID=A0A387BQ38_9MICO|nr:ABC transporter ATP-binding protein [Gryllotalpicola protaetiae]AYG03140.1 ABC transporter ATP-binding protein [Gryllotalpicola protaetiae]
MTTPTALLDRPTADQTDAVIRIRGLAKSYTKARTPHSGDDWALKDIDLDVRQGEFLVLLGPSGCGKTTLLRSIAGLEEPESGSIQIAGEDVYDASRHLSTDAKRRPVSMIFQSYALWPHMTAARNVAFPLKCAGVKRSEIPARVRDILEKVGIGHLSDRYPGQMSGGQQQRLALARALVVGRRIVLFDEPLSNVDAQVRERLRLELIRMQRALDFTAIYVTHDQGEAMELADRIAVMSLGRIAQLGRPSEMYHRPADIHVARFLGQSNELPFTVEATPDGTIAGAGTFGGIRLHTTQRETGLGDGEKAVAFGRPEHFTVSAGRPAQESDLNTWAGTLEAIRFLGSHTEAVVQVGAIRMRVWVHPDRDGNLPAGLEDGAPVTVFIDPRHLTVMREA